MADHGSLRSSLEQGLSPVRSRQRLARAGRWAAWGLLPSAAVAAALGAANLLGVATIAPWIAIAVLAAGPILGALAGLLKTNGLNHAAEAVDAHYGLKDRATTALSLPAGDSPWTALQRADAEAHLASVEPKQVVPFRPTRRLALGSALAAAVLGLALFPAPRQAAAEISGPDQDLLSIAAEVEAEIDKLEEENAEAPSPEIEELIAELREHAERLKEPETDAREALAELSRMEEAIRQRADYDAAAVTANMQSLAAAMEASEALAPVSEALKADDLKKAAEELEQVAPENAPRRERKAAAERMKKAAKKMSDGGMGQMSQATGQMADGMSEGDSSKTSAGAKKLSSLLKQSAFQKALTQSLRKKLDRLSECKSKCSSCLSKSACSACGSKLCEGGKCNGSKNSTALGQGKRSNSPKNTWGMKTAGNIDDPATGLGGNRNRDDITGVAGDGPSEYETTNSPEGEESARRGYSERYSEYQKRSEEVLESEDIPLGHRRLIRDYFEAIRPNAADQAEIDAAK
ncbi:hypothetical protein LzC2_14830 [Planctomycetes bacterium LzC2]|uniref:Uncharacterized protein n=2 Tax=Alienimonas chondri TaxID=2681879 RepID=A0ABX1VCC1_9PLAN|nr:hypothetical protein [Alienimonas chondri]